MTEKRFTLKYINEQHISANLYDNGTFIGSIRIGERLIAELLNSLNNENEQLKKDCTALISHNQEYRKQNEWLKSIHFANDVLKENEQLKQGMDKLFNYFAKWFEEERGIYIEEFIEIWENIQKEELEDD